MKPEWAAKTYRGRKINWAAYCFRIFEDDLEWACNPIMGKEQATKLVCAIVSDAIAQYRNGAKRNPLNHESSVAKFLFGSGLEKLIDLTGISLSADAVRRKLMDETMKN